MEWNYTIANLSTIHLIFDTGLHRTLMLSQKESDQKSQIWGKPQPETVRDYSFEVRDANDRNKWSVLFHVVGNYQRRREHNVTSVANGLQIDALRVNVTATNGWPHVRICEIRIYDSINGDESFPVKL